MGLRRWLASWFVTPRSYRVWVYAERRWWPAGIVRAEDWRAARRVAAKRNPGYQCRVEEAE